MARSVHSGNNAMTARATGSRSFEPAFHSPPLTKSPGGKERKIGFEIEYSGISLEATANVIRRLLGGTCREDGPYVYFVDDTRVGTFKLEIDSGILKERRYEGPLEQIGLFDNFVEKHSVGKRMRELFGFLVPFEIITPPMPLSELSVMESLRHELHLEGARGTRSAVRFAFGLHINPEIALCDTHYLSSILKAFAILRPLVEQYEEIDISRELSPYIKNFSLNFLRRIFALPKDTSLEDFISTYLHFNKDKNRRLDLLPLFAWLLEERELDSYLSKRSVLVGVKSRPTFHYRLPNCLVDNPDWRIADEWNRWVAIERLAMNESLLNELTGRYFSHSDGVDEAKIRAHAYFPDLQALFSERGTSDR